jgi:hypothetical protein
LDNIVGLRGQPVTYLSKPEPDVVEQLEILLEKAKSGEIVGMAAAVLYKDDVANRCFHGIINYSMVGRLAELQGLLLKQLSGE